MELFSGITKLTTLFQNISLQAFCSSSQCSELQNDSYHLGLAPHILLAVRYCSTQRGTLYILAPVLGATSTLFCAQQRSCYGWNSQDKIEAFNNSLDRTKVSDNKVTNWMDDRWWTLNVKIFCFNTMWKGLIYVLNYENLLFLWPVK